MSKLQKKNLNKDYQLLFKDNMTEYEYKYWLAEYKKVLAEKQLLGL